MAYHLEGRLLEVCNCRVLCPCWIGEDPDYGTCDTIIAWHFDKGTIDDVDVSGRTIALIAHVPGNILEGQLERRRLPRRQGVDGAGGGDPRRVHGQARRSGRRARQAGRRGRVGREGADHVRGAGRQGHDQDRQRRLRGARAVQERHRRDHDAPGHGVLDGARRAGVRRQVAAYRSKVPKLGIDLDLKGHNALQSTFVFTA